MKRLTYRRLAVLEYLCPAFCLLVVLATRWLVAAPPAADEFVIRQGDQLTLSGRPFRFLSWNIPNLHYIEDDMRFSHQMPFRWPDEFEIRDALESVRQMGGTVVRTYVLSVRKEDDPDDLPCHVLAPGKFNEEAFQALDTVLAVAREKGIRVIIPFVDNWHWWGGVPQYAAFRGKPAEAFWTDRQLIDDFQQTIHHLLTRVNRRTGIAYKDDPTILAWETGNEVQCSHSWTRTIAAYIKRLDSKHLVLDGKQANILSQESIDNPDIDLLQTHHYERDSHEMATHVRQSARLARGKKPYHVGEFGFLPTDGMLEVIDTIIAEGISGGLIWSLRFHTRDGGFYWHHEPSGGDLFKAYHWPGFPSGSAYDEQNFLALVREKAYAIRGEPMPPLPVPAAPTLLEVTSGGMITWQGSAGASRYDIERADSPAGRWQVVGKDISDAATQHQPLFADTSFRLDTTPSYRIIAHNPSGASPPSSPLAPQDLAMMTHKTFVDELRHGNLIYQMTPDAKFQQNEARKFKEDAHRLVGQPGTTVTWKMPARIVSIKLFLFGESNANLLHASASVDGKVFRPIPITRTAFATDAAGTYGYWIPLVYQSKQLPANSVYFRIAFDSTAHLSRLEIGYRDE